MTTANNTTLETLEHLLESGIRGKNKKAIQQAIDTLTETTGDLTDLECKRLKYGDRPLRDKKFLGLRLEPKQKGHIWFYRYKWNNKQPELKLGIYPDVGLAEARERWEQARILLNRGVNPKTRGGEAGQMTVSQLCEKYIRLAELKKRSWDSDRLMLEKNVLPYIGERIASEITTADAAELVDKILERGKIRQAEKLITTCRFMFNVGLGIGKGRKWLVIEGSSKVEPWLEMSENPFLHIVTPEREPEICVLKNGALKKYLDKFSTAEFSDDTRDVLQLQLLCNTRINEPANMTWQEIDLNSKTWTIPGERTKNGTEHTVMLSKQAVEIIERQQTKNDKYVFSFNGHNRKSLNQLISKEIRGARKHLGVPDNFTSHSLRHTGQTLLASMGCSSEIRDRISNHVRNKKTDMAARYNSHEFDIQAREWLQQLANKIDSIKRGVTHAN